MSQWFTVRSFFYYKNLQQNFSLTLTICRILCNASPWPFHHERNVDYLLWFT